MYRLLLVDDEIEARDLLCNFFPWGESGFEVVAQKDNGADAMSYLSQNEVDVILCDIRMPKMNGIDLAKWVHMQSSKPLIIFLSAYKEFEYARKALDYGVRHYIVKPARYDELMKVFTDVKKELDEQASISMGNEIAPLPSETHDQSSDLIRRIENYLESNYQNASLKALSQLVHMNPNYLSQFFKQKTGCNFSEHLLKIKMKKAVELLSDPKIRISRISDLLGYTSPKNFTRSFRNHYHMTPNEYRKQLHHDNLPKSDH